MIARAYIEDQPCEQPGIGLFTVLGGTVAWPPHNAGEPRDAGLLGRETKGEAVLVSRLRAALGAKPTEKDHHEK